MGHLGCRYIEESSRLDYSNDTRLHATPQELKAYHEKLASAPSASQPFSPHFICECYFMTAKALHLGYSVQFSNLEDWGKVSFPPSEAVLYQDKPALLGRNFTAAAFLQACCPAL